MATSKEGKEPKEGGIAGRENGTQVDKADKNGSNKSGGGEKNAGGEKGRKLAGEGEKPGQIVQIMVDELKKKNKGLEGSIKPNESEIPAESVPTPSIDKETKEGGSRNKN